MLTEQLSERLKAIADSVARLPLEMRERLAAVFESALDNALWDAQLRDPDHLAALRTLADEARRERKLPMPNPSDTDDAHLVDPDDLELLECADRMKLSVFQLSPRGGRLANDGL